MFREFREFAIRGNVMDMAVGIIIGAAFTSVVGSLVNDVFTPVLGLLGSQSDLTELFWVLREGSPEGPYITLAAAKAAGAVTLNFGVFVGTLLHFLIVALAVFFVVRLLNRIKREFESEPVAVMPNIKTCDYCRSAIHIDATRCPNCTSELRHADLDQGLNT